MAAGIRILGSLLGGCLAAFALLWLMHWLIRADQPQLQAGSERPVMEFVRLRQEGRTQLRERQLPEPEPPEEQAPPPPTLPEVSSAPVPQPTPKIAMTLPRIPLDIDGPYIGPVRQGPPDRDFVAISRMPPTYPYRAQRRGIEGWVRVSFLITEQGEVADTVVTGAEPEGVFEQAALRAVRKWRFKPRIRDGKPVAVRADQVVRFRIEGAR